MNRIKYPKRSGSQTVFPDKTTTAKLEQAANKWLATLEKPSKKEEKKKKRRSRNRAKPGLEKEEET